MCERAVANSCFATAPVDFLRKLPKAGFSGLGKERRARGIHKSFKRAAEAPPTAALQNDFAGSVKGVSGRKKKLFEAPLIRSGGCPRPGR